MRKFDVKKICGDEHYSGGLNLLRVQNTECVHYGNKFITIIVRVVQGISQEKYGFMFPINVMGKKA